MGFTYLGPVDGHDLDRLCNVLEWAKELRCPVVVHVNTVKGKGYSFAEQNPGRFHGVVPFDPQTGLALHPSGESFSSVFGKTLTDCAAQDARICAITAAMVVCPICTHNMRFSSYVLSPDHTLTIESMRSGRKPVYLFVDESRAFSLRPEDQVCVRKSRYVTRLVRLSEKSFCEIFAKKMLPGGMDNEK
jgi:Deoxyxylulose-5-phosphate synthase